MKMRKRIAALIAVAMIAALMPMTAFAASDNRVTHTVTYKKDSKLADATIGPKVEFKLKDTFAATGITTKQAFYLELTGAEWLGLDDMATSLNAARLGSASYNSTTKVLTWDNGAVPTPVSIEITRDDDTTLALRPQTDIVAGDPGKFYFPILAQLKGGEAKITVDPSDTVISKSEHVFAVSSDAKAIVTMGDIPKFSGSGDIVKITLEEAYIGAFKKGDDDQTIEIELRDSDFILSDIEIEGKKAFAGVTLNKSERYTDRATIYEVTLTDTASFTQRGVIEITGRIKADRNAAKGDVLATLSGSIVDKQSFVIAENTDHTTVLKDVAEETKEVVTGNEVEVEFSLTEEIANSLVGARPTSFIFPDGIKIKDGSLEMKAGDKTDEYSAVAPAVNFKNFEKLTNVTDGKRNSFTIDSFGAQKGEKAVYTFKATLLVPNAYDADEITITAEGRSLSDTHELVIAKVTKPVTVEVTPLDIKVGLKQQIGGKIVIKENEKEALKKSTKRLTRTRDDDNVITETETSRDAYLWIKLADRDGGLKIKDADIEVTEGDLVLDLDEKYVSDGWIEVRIKRQSTVPSTIEVTNIEVSADRTVPEGKYNIKVGGPALSTNTYRYEFDERALADDTYKEYGNNILEYIEFFDSIVEKEFINITTKNTEDGGSTKGAEVVSFVIGNNKFIVDGVEVEMDAAPYIKDGRTMVPVRYLAEALGIDGAAVKFNAGVVTLFAADGKVIQVSVGSKNLVVNGMTIPMVAAAEIVEGRTYVPVTEIGVVFGVSGSWDPATQTATFSKN